MQAYMAIATKTRASKLAYQSITQLTINGFETPFVKHLDPKNRWVVLANQIPWDQIVGVYLRQLNNDVMGASSINPRVVLGAIMVKHLKNLSDADTILEIQENVYLQFFLGYSSFTPEPPFDPSLFVEIRKRLGDEQINAINEKIVSISVQRALDNQERNKPSSPSSTSSPQPQSDPLPVVEKINDSQDVPKPATDSCPLEPEQPRTHHGRLIVDATACPQDISYPTDINLLNEAREKSLELIDILYLNHPDFGNVGFQKPRTYRDVARKDYLNIAKRRKKSSQIIRRGIREQLQYLNRNIGHIHSLLDGYADNEFPLNQRERTYLWVIQELYRQQYQMWIERKHRIEDRIVSIHQPHVRPIVRGKEHANVEFGAKIQVSLVDGYAFLDHLSWDAYNEGTLLMDSIEQYKRRYGYYPAEVLADQIYCNRVNRSKLKEVEIKLLSKPLGRPPAMKVEHVRPGERNPIEGKFGQAKVSYGMNRIKARLKITSQSWIASIVLVLNLVKLAGQAPYYLYSDFMVWIRMLVINSIIQISYVLRRGLLFQ